MRSERIIEAIGLLDDDLITEAEAAKGAAVPRRVWLGLIAAAACAAITVGVIWGSGGFTAVEPDPDESAAESTAATATTTASTVTVTTTKSTTTEAPTTETQTTPVTQATQASRATAASSTAKPLRPTGVATSPGTDGSTGDVFAPTYATNKRCVKAAVTPQINYEQSLPTGYAQFSARIMEQLLSDSSTRQSNKVFSPLNLYMALSMLTETTGGNSRAQLLALLGSPDIDTLRADTAALWNTHYRDSEQYRCIPGTSIWLQSGFPFHYDTVERLADTYHASVFQGQMGDPAYTALLQEWLNVHTCGLLEEAVAQQELKANTVMALYATLYYKSNWLRAFSEEQNTEGIFHSTIGGRVVTYMHNRHLQASYIEGNGFRAVRLDMLQDDMWLILPDEGVDAEALFANPEVQALIHADSETERPPVQPAMVDLTVPKFDVSGSWTSDLIEALRTLGVTDVFDGKADFSPLSELGGLYVSGVGQKARIIVDEEGVTAAAMTGVTIAASAPSFRTEMVFDRPFAFVITTSRGVTPFAGVVNVP